MCALLDARCAAADYAARRTTALLSATLHSNLGSLAAMSLREPAAVGFECDMVEGRMVVKQAQQAQQGQAEGEPAAPAAAAGQQRFSLPPQLRQSFLEVPCKLRLVALGALLRARVAAAPGTCKLVAFLATTDAVEYYHAGKPAISVA
jgi:ATP-dependent RNA helicase DDX31/DBP7